MNSPFVFLLLLLSISRVHALTIHVGNGGGAVDHVRFTAAPDATGTNLSGSFESYPFTLVDFSSSTALEIQSGAATLGGLNNSTFQNLTFALANSGTFSKAVVNPDATADGLISFDVGYLGLLPATFSQSFILSAHGQNFFTIEAEAGEQITNITFSTANSAFEDSGQVRIGGFQDPLRVPDGGTTVLLLGVAIALLGLVGHTGAQRKR